MKVWGSRVLGSGLGGPQDLALVGVPSAAQHMECWQRVPK